MTAMVIDRSPLLFFSRHGRDGHGGWVLDADAGHYTDAQAAAVVRDYKFAGLVFTLPGLATGLAASDSRARVERYAAMVESGAEAAARLTPAAGDFPDFAGARAEVLLADGWDPDAVRHSSELAGPFNDPGEVADRMQEMTREA